LGGSVSLTKVSQYTTVASETKFNSADGFPGAGFDPKKLETLPTEWPQVLIATEFHA
jgi:hypothetical protein